MVALESFPMHLAIIPTWWLELHESSNAQAKEFINLLCNNCTNFKDFNTSILLQERLFLTNDSVFRVLKEFVPNVCILDLVFLFMSKNSLISDPWIFIIR